MMGRFRSTRSPAGVTGDVIVSEGMHYDVRAYGALGDGSTDDTAAIQAAIDAAIAGGNGVVFFPIGTYLVSSTLNVTASAITLTGCYKSIIKSSANPAIRLLGSKNLLSGFRINGNSPATGAYAIDGRAEGTTGCDFNKYIDLYLSGYDSGIRISAVSGSYGAWWNQIVRPYFDLTSRAKGSGSAIRFDDSAGDDPTTCVVMGGVLRHVKVCVDIVSTTPGKATNHVIEDIELTEAGTGVHVDGTVYNKVKAARGEYLDDYFVHEENSANHNFYELDGHVDLMDTTHIVLTASSQVIGHSMYPGLSPRAWHGQYFLFATDEFRIGTRAGSTRYKLNSAGLHRFYSTVQLDSTIANKAVVGTMAGTETFDNNDGNVFIKDPGGANRNFNPSGTFTAGTVITVVNTADAAETITFDNGGIQQGVGQNECGIFVYNGSAWKVVWLGQNDLTSDGSAILAGLTLTADISAAGGFKQPFNFMQSNVAANQTAVAIDVLGLAGNTEVVMPYAGSVIGISVASNAARSAGTLTVDATVDGVVTGLQAVLDDDPTTYALNTQAKDTDTFTAGQRIGVKITTDGAWAPVTADIVVAVIVEM